MECHVKKIDAMYLYYDRALSGKCGDCPHFLEGEWHDRKYFKCTVYGLSHSAATDWRKSYPACGLINQPFPDNETRVMTRYKPGKPIGIDPIEGQMTMFGGQE